MSDKERREDPWFEHMDEDDDYKHIDIISIALTVIVIAFIAVGVWIGL